MSNHQYNEAFITLNVTEKFEGQLRWKIGLGTHPCIRTRIDKRCTFCGFKDLEQPIPANQVDTVFQTLLESSPLELVKRLELYVSGSFFDDVEVSPNARLNILRCFAQNSIPEILIESRPEFITAANLNALAETIDPQRITVGIGVETMDDQARKPLSKGTTTKKISQSIQLIAQTGMNFQAYMLLKLPNAKNDQEAVSSFMKDVDILLKLTQNQSCTVTIAIQPTFVAHNTPFEQDFKKSTFRPAWLYTIALVLKKLLALKEKYPRMRIILGNENDNVEVIAIPSNYTNAIDYKSCSCSKSMREMLYHVNESEEALVKTIQFILHSSCSCKAIWESEMRALLGEHV
jgi:radical SAM enzyme (TIGR01210 family)